MRTEAGHSIRSLRATVVANVARWRTFPNFRYVGIARRIRGGRRFNDLTVVYYVSRKSEVGPGERLPRELAIAGSGHAPLVTDVQIAPNAPVFLGAYAGDCIVAGDSDQGTATVVGMAHANGPAYVFTCSHVVTNVKTGAGMNAAVGWRDPANDTVFAVGETVFAVRLMADRDNRFDAALVRLSQDAPTDGHLRIRGEADPIVAFDYFRTDQSGDFYYSTARGRRACRTPVPMDGAVAVSYVGPAHVNEGSYPFIDVWRLASDGSGPDHGDSGALIYKPTSRGLVGYGVLFAGVPGQEVWAVSARPFMDFLKANAG